MRYKEFKEKVEAWGRRYDYKPVIEADFHRVYITLEEDDYSGDVCTIHNSERFVIDLNFESYRDFSENEKNDLFKIVTEFAATKPEDRKDEKRFIIPLPGLVTTDGKQQYLTKKGGYLFACRKMTDKTLRQTWTEDELIFIPEEYRQFAEEFDEENLIRKRNIRELSK